MKVAGSSFKQFIKLLYFVCRLHRQAVVPVSNGRVNIFKATCESDCMLPENKDSLVLHSRRANYQTAIWRRCLQCAISPPSPVSHGWKLEEQVSGVTFHQPLLHWVSLQSAVVRRVVTQGGVPVSVGACPALVFASVWCAQIKLSLASLPVRTLINWVLIVINWILRRRTRSLSENCKTQCDIVLSTSC